LANDIQFAKLAKVFPPPQFCAIGGDEKQAVNQTLKHKRFKSLKIIYVHWSL